MDKVIYRFWAKARRTDQDRQPHLLPYHSIDVAAVLGEILDRHSRLEHTLAQGLGIQPESLRPHLMLRAGLHDSGKFAGGFQHQIPELVRMLDSPSTSRPYPPYHVELGAMAWGRWLIPAWSETYASQSTWKAYDWKDYLSAWSDPFTGHHGQPPRTAEQPIHRADHHWDTPGKTALHAFAHELARIVQAERAPLLSSDDVDALIASAKWASWRLAGLVVLADWIASDETQFPPLADPLNLDTYWVERALPQAGDAVRRSRILPHVMTSANATRLFDGRTPTPLQEVVAALTPRGKGALYILEDLTGSGKTEAALHLAARIGAGHAAGIYFGLPTQATATAMHERAASWTKVLFGDDNEATQALVHGETYLVHGPSFVTTDTSASPAEDGRRSAREWLADSRKKALLSSIGIGTVDQALLAVLPVRHQCLRLHALADRILIVDEVHAYDDYTFGLLERLVEHQARAGMPTILMSATLPLQHRNRLLLAHARGRGIEPARSSEGRFPLLVCAHDGGLEEVVVAPATWARRELPVVLVHEETQVQAIVTRALQEGACVCWIRNTVDEAIRAADALAHLDPVVLHARFTAAHRARIEEAVKVRTGPQSTFQDRHGFFVVATQVAEQSLDLDFDLVVSDLAPIDALIQRVGRMRRHRRDARGDRAQHEARLSRTFVVHSPAARADAGTTWCREWSPGTASVYPDTARLWLTASLLQSAKILRFPEDVRLLLENVYGIHAIQRAPESLQAVAIEQEGERSGKRSAAALAALRLSDGYSSGGAWEDDTSLRTRLGEAQHDVYFLQGPPSEPRPLSGSSWTDSRIRLRASVAPARPAEATHPVVARALPDKGRHGRCVLLDAALEGTAESPQGTLLRYRYSPTHGLRIERMEP